MSTLLRKNSKNNLTNVVSVFGKTTKTLMNLFSNCSNKYINSAPATKSLAKEILKVKTRGYIYIYICSSSIEAIRHTSFHGMRILPM